jgi:hypothetical protein
VIKFVEVCGVFAVVDVCDVDFGSSVLNEPEPEPTPTDPEPEFGLKPDSKPDPALFIATRAV